MTILALLLASAGGASDLTGLQGLNDPDYQRFESESLGRAFHVLVGLPEGYETSDGRYPVVYLLDGGHTFPMLAGYYRYLVLGEEMPEAIIVGISYGTDHFEAGNFRGRDFTAPSPEREHYGGAKGFQRFLEGEPLPYIEGEYRADPARRIIFGQSLGGQFVLYTALTRPSLFWGHIASNPALHRNLEFFLDLGCSGEPSGSKVFASSGSDDDARFRGPALEWFAQCLASDGRPWALKTVTLDGEGHFSAAPAAFRRGLTWILSE